MQPACSTANVEVGAFVTSNLLYEIFSLTEASFPSGGILVC